MSFNLVANFVAFQLGWLVAVVGAGQGFPVAGVVYALCFAAVHHWHVRSRRMEELALVVAGAGFGYVVDSLLVLANVISFPPHASLGYPSTLWMICLWLMFSMTLRHSLGWLREQYLLAAALGAVFGPLAYWAGSRLDAIELNGGATGLAVIGAAWATSMLWLVRLELMTRAGAGRDGSNPGGVVPK